MKKLIYLITIILFLASCRNEKTTDKKIDSIPAKADTLTYKYDSVKVLSKNWIKPKDNSIIDTANALIKYPVFNNDTLNNFIKRQVFNYFSPEEQATSYQDIARSFISGYDSFYKENPNTPQWWYLLIDIKVLRQTKNYIAISYIHSDYVGGAHGNTNISYLNYNPKTNQPLTLDSLIIADKKVELTKLGESIFRKDEGLTATEPLDEKYFFEHGKFSLAQSFYVGKEGLVFTYNPYEIKPYAAGITELIIPFAALKGIAKPNNILSATN